MPHIVTEPCLGCKHADCVDVCPVECFHQDGKMLLIDPFECIDCQRCVPVCPEEAIFAEDDVPPEFESWIDINAEKAPGLPLVTSAEEVEKIKAEGHCQ